jgi:hypothetical protein
MVTRTGAWFHKELCLFKVELIVRHSSKGADRFVNANPEKKQKSKYFHYVITSDLFCVILYYEERAKNLLEVYHYEWNEA